MDLERILGVPFFIVALTPSCCAEPIWIKVSGWWQIQLFYYGTSSRIVFVRFLGELKTPKRYFEINWPLSNVKTKREISSNLWGLLKKPQNHQRIAYLKLLVELFSGTLALLPPFAADAAAMISGCCTILIRLSNLKSLSVKTELRRITGLESMPENKWQVRYFKESIS